MTPGTSDKLVNYLMERTDQFGNYIAELAKQLGVAAEHVYEVLIRQQYTEAIGLLVQNISYIVLLVFAAVLVTKFWKHQYKKDPKFDSDFSGISAFLTVIIVGFSLWFIADIIGDIKMAVMKLLNPEYYALEDIMKFIQGKIKK